ncbi:MAG TPA: tRNA (uridine(34)/cytosine(34)/5-carboxymethylaminomethyluridine(34)-2'-O)-methyltransferase TrmL [Spongiibacteraceae bacterium]|nr:tRNA (uridine(34)/cytosine(34)/5-carboxymethylaminomethyluridine(34)-2'-O)-methyltransferase TrmL [Spongiibacteraceae bacterium]
MFNVVLVEPEIPPNTGNVIRLCANTGARLHLIEPLGFVLEDKKLRRAGPDYREWADVQIHKNLEAYIHTQKPNRLFAFSTKGTAHIGEAQYHAGDALLFGPESRGLPHELLQTLPTENILRLPMRAESRSLNLSNTVAVAVFEAWRQWGYDGGQ